MSNALMTLSRNLAEKFGMGSDGDVLGVLKATCFKGGATDAQLTALLVVAKEYGLNPFTKEIFAFPDKGAIVPVVGVDGWARIINSHPQMDGMDFVQDEESCTCIIYRKDRNHPTKVTEWMSECRRSVGPWASHPKRMLRHKAMIQAARLAFGFAGIYDQDEGERIVESVSAKTVDAATGEILGASFCVVTALNEVDACLTIDEVDAVFQRQGKHAADAKDTGGYKALRDAVRSKKATLSQVTDVEERVPA